MNRQPDYLQNFVDDKLSLAAKLADGELGAWYGDGILIISSVISSFAAELWPGDRIDRARFIELWVSHTSAQTDSSLISVPLLIDSLRQKGDRAAVSTLKSTNDRAFGYNDTLVIKGSDVDLPDTEIARICPAINLQFIRKHSYPAVFYKEVRSTYVHEYTIGRFASTHEMGDNDYSVGYVNQVESPSRVIHFPIFWLQKVTRAIHQSFLAVHENAPLPIPAKWWIEHRK